MILIIIAYKLEAKMRRKGGAPEAAERKSYKSSKILI